MVMRLWSSRRCCVRVEAGQMHAVCVGWKQSVAERWWDMAGVVSRLTCRRLLRGLTLQWTGGGQLMSYSADQPCGVLGVGSSALRLHRPLDCWQPAGATQCAFQPGGVRV